jgi:uncharacterized protein involved in exopolysaccharide biosynthesis
MALSSLSEPATAGRQPADVAGVRLETYLTVVRRHALGILGLTLIGAIAGAALAARHPVMYEARTTVAVNRLAGDSTPTPAPTSPMVLAVFSNQSLLLQLLAELGLDRPPNSLTAESFLKDHMIVEELVPGSLLQIRVRESDPSFAVRVCNRLVSLAIELNTRLSAEKTLAGQEFLKRHLDSSRADLADIEHRLLDFRMGSQVELRREEVDALLDARRELVAIDVRIAAEKGRLAAAMSELARRSRTVPSSRRGPNPFPTIPPPSTSSYQSRPAPAIEEPPPERKPETFLADQSSNTVDPVYEILDYEVASGRVRLAELESRRSELASAVGLTRPPLRKFTELYRLESEQARLQAEYDLATSAYEDALTRFKQGDDDGPSPDEEAFKVVDPAVSAPRISRPSYAIASLLGAALGFGAALLFAFLAEVVRDPLRAGA